MKPRKGTRRTLFEEWLPVLASEFGWTPTEVREVTLRELGVLSQWLHEKYRKQG